MRIRATCNVCGRDFLFFQLYNTDPWRSDRCPHCGRHLGQPNMRHLALAADRAAAGLVDALRAIADRDPGFTIQRDSILERIEEAIDELSGPHEKTISPSRVDDGSLTRGWPWSRRAS
jgi:ribosomal protein S14